MGPSVPSPQKSMNSPSFRSAGGRSDGSWCSPSPRSCSIATFAASLLSQSHLDELAVLYVLPVMLAGLELGTRGGAGAAAIALGLLLVESGRDSELTAVGLAASTAVLLIAGMIAGRFSERMRAGRDRQERLLASGTEAGAPGES